METEEQLYHEISTVFLKRRLKRTGRMVLLLAALIPLFYGSIYTYARIRIAEAKQLGVFPTLEDAVYGVLADEVRGARVVRLDISHTDPCFPEGKLPFIWCVSTSVFYDRNPEGSNQNIHRGYSSFYRLREGWVYMPDGIPGLVDEIMELFGMEGVGD